MKNWITASIRNTTYIGGEISVAIAVFQMPPISRALGDFYINDRGILLPTFALLFKAAVIIML
jgi:hypothetical protein